MCVCEGGGCVVWGRGSFRGHFMHVKVRWTRLVPGEFSLWPIFVPVIKAIPAPIILCGGVCVCVTVGWCEFMRVSIGVSVSLPLTFFVFRVNLVPFGQQFHCISLTHRLSYTDWLLLTKPLTKLDYRIWLPILPTVTTTTDPLDYRTERYPLPSPTTISEYSLNQPTTTTRNAHDFDPASLSCLQGKLPPRLFKITFYSLDIILRILWLPKNVVVTKEFCG